MIEFKRGFRHGRGILLDQPDGDVIGIVECAKPGCAWRVVLHVEDGQDEKLAENIDRFLKSHPCGKEPAS